MKIAYLVNHYPAISHSFIRREILALERLGHEVLRISIRGWADAQRGAEDRLEQARTRYVLRGGAVPLLISFLRILATNPAGLFRAIVLTLKVGLRAELRQTVFYFGERWQLIELLQAEVVEELASGAEHRGLARHIAMAHHGTLRSPTKYSSVVSCLPAYRIPNAVIPIRYPKIMMRSSVCT